MLDRQRNRASRFRAGTVARPDRNTASSTTGEAGRGGLLITPANDKQHDYEKAARTRSASESSLG
jgi:hypothetical protein